MCTKICLSFINKTTLIFSLLDTKKQKHLPCVGHFFNIQIIFYHSLLVDIYIYSQNKRKFKLKKLDQYLTSHSQINNYHSGVTKLVLLLSISYKSCYSKIEFRNKI